MVYLLVFLTGFSVSFLLTPVVARLSRRLGIVAEPGGRRKHAGRVAKLGGIPLLVGWLAAIIVAMLWLPPTGDDAIRLRGVALGTFIVFAGGLLDDRRELPAWIQLMIQIVGGLVAMSHIIFIEVFTTPLAGGWPWSWAPLSQFFTVEGSLVWIWRPLALLITLVWLLGMMNTVNWLDGLDGLASGVGLVAVLLFAWHSYQLEQYSVALFPLALGGALLGFLPYNFAPARIFLGTAGVYLLGYQLATLSILSPAKIATALLVMVLPIVDVAWLIVDRVRRGQSPWRGDRGHLHYRLADRGVPVPWIVIGYYSVAIILGLIVVTGPSPQAKLLTLLALGSGILGFLIWFSGHARSGREAADR